ncbi:MULTISPECIES: hypothetical protein [Cyanophyceae]|nr:MULTISPECIES: hypothetical protein [Cyanophyceae]ACB00553.1 conserved hypothetical protein [Picosynechococcus sp. PCC 7002]
MPMVSPDSAANLSEQLDRIQQELLAIAAQYEGNGERLLEILRELELTHRQISEDYFYPSLPERRRDLYNILRDMETEGGWPYIARPKLQFILEKFLAVESEALENDSEDDGEE